MGSEDEVLELGLRMVELEHLYESLRSAGRIAESNTIWRRREGVQFSRSVLMRQIWAERARRLLRISG